MSADFGCRLLEVDFSAIEAKQTGWFARDPSLIRLAALGIHAALVSHLVGEPYDPRASDADLGLHFKALKKAHRLAYDRAKRFIYAQSYGMTTRGLVLQFPQLFPTTKIAEQYEALFATLAPTVKGWQRQVRERAWKQHYLGGVGDHPFGYKHWFWAVWTYKPISDIQYARLLKAYPADPPVALFNGKRFKVVLGNDGNRAVAFYPQSTAAGVLKEAMLRLFDPDSPSYIGDAYFGRTPLRAPIHDSLLLEIPRRQWDRVLERVIREMVRPVVEQPCPVEWGLGPSLQIGVEAKASAVGGSWAAMEVIDSPGGLGWDVYRDPIEPEQREEWDDLDRVVPTAARLVAAG